MDFFNIRYSEQIIGDCPTIFSFTVRHLGIDGRFLVIVLHRRDQPWRTNTRILTAIPKRTQKGENTGEHLLELPILYLIMHRKTKML